MLEVDENINYNLFTVDIYDIRNRTRPEIRIIDIPHTDFRKMNLSRDTVGYTKKNDIWPVMQIVQSIDFSLTDALKMTLTCKATVEKIILSGMI